MSIKFNLKKTTKSKKDFYFWKKIYASLGVIVKQAQTNPQDEGYEPEGRTFEDVDEEDDANSREDIKANSLNMFVGLFSRVMPAATAITIAKECLTIIELDKINKQGGIFEGSILNLIKEIAPAIISGKTTKESFDVQGFINKINTIKSAQKANAERKSGRPVQQEQTQIQENEDIEETFEQKMEKYKNLPVMVFTSSGKEKRNLPPEYKKIDSEFYDMPRDLIKGEGLLEEKSVEYRPQLLQMLKRAIGGNIDQEKAQSALDDAINLGRSFSRNFTPVSFRKGIYETKALEDSGDNRIRFILSNTNLFNEYNEVFKSKTGKDLNAIIKQNNMSVVQGSRNLDVYSVIAEILRENPNNGLNDFLRSKIKSMNPQMDEKGRTSDSVANWIIKTAKEIYYGESGFDKDLEVGKPGEKTFQQEGTAPGISRMDETQEDQKNQALATFSEELKSVFDDMNKLTYTISAEMRKKGDYAGALSLENLINAYNKRLEDLLSSGKIKLDKDVINILWKPGQKAGIKGSFDITKLTDTILRKMITRFMPGRKKTDEEGQDSATQKQIEQMTGQGFIERMEELKKLANKIQEIFAANGSIEKTAQEVNVDENYVKYLLTNFSVISKRYGIHNFTKEQEKQYNDKIRGGLRPLAERVYEARTQYGESFEGMKPEFLEEARQYEDILADAKRFLKEKAALKKYAIRLIEKIREDNKEKWNTLDERNIDNLTKTLDNLVLQGKAKSNFIGFLSFDEIRKIVDAYTPSVKKRKRTNPEQIIEEINNEERNIDIDAIIMSGSSRSTKENPLSMPLYSVVRHDMSGITLRYKVFDWCETIKNMLSEGKVRLESARLFITLMNPIVADESKYSGINCTEGVLGTKLQDLPGRAKRPREKVGPEITASSYITFGILKKALDISCRLKSLQNSMIKVASKQSFSDKINMIMNNAYAEIDRILGK